MSGRYSFTDLVDLTEVRTAFPKIGITLRILLPDKTFLVLEQHLTPLDALLQHNNGFETLWDEQLLKDAALYKGVSVHECPSGLLQYVAPIVSEERLLAVLVSGCMRPGDLTKPLNFLTNSSGLSLVELQHAVEQLPSANVDYLSTIVELVYSFVNQLVRTGLERTFLLEAVAQPDLDDLLDLIVTRVPILIWNTFCSAFLWDQKRDMFVLKKTSNPDLQAKVDREGYHPGEGLTGWVGKYSRPLCIKNVRDRNELAQYADKQANIPAPVWSGAKTGVTKMADGQGSACMIVPIQSDQTNQTVGVIRLLPSQDGDRIVLRHFDLLSKLAKLISVAVQHAQLTDSIAELAQAVGHSDVEEFLRVVLNQISQWFRSFSTHVRIYEPTQDLWYLLAVNDSPHTEVIRQRKVVPTKQVIGKVVGGEQDLHLDNDVQNDPGFRQELAAARERDLDYARYLEQIGATLMVPLHDRKSGRVIGMLNLHRRIGDRFAPYETRPALAMAYVLARSVTALFFSYHFKGEEIARRFLDSSDKSAFNKRAIAERIAQAAMEVVDCDAVLVRELDEVNHCLPLISSSFKEERDFRALTPPSLRVGEGAAGIAVKEKRYYIFSANDSDSTYQREYREAKEAGNERKLQFLAHIGSGIAVPLLVADSCVGVLTVLDHVSDRYQPQDADVLRTVGDKAALLLHCVQLAEERVRPQSQLHGILEATQRMLKANDENKIYRIALTAATHKDGLGFSRALILLADQDGYRMRLPLARGGAYLDEQLAIWSEPEANDLASAYEVSENDFKFNTDPKFNGLVSSLKLAEDEAPKTARLISMQGEDWEQRILNRLRSDQPGQIDQAAVVPMQAPGEEPIGLLIVDNRYLSRIIKPDDIPSLQILATQVSSAVSSLRQAARAGQARLEASVEISAQVAHMVGNRVDSVSNLVQELRLRLQGQPNTDEIVNDLLPRIKAGLEDARKFARDIREFQRSQHLLIRNVNLNDLIQEAIRESKPLKDGIQLELNRSIMRLQCDPDKIKYCIMELIKNAVEAGATHLKAVVYDLADLRQVEIRICDNGPGISEEYQSRIFDPYFTTKKKGTGLGLPHIISIMEAHRGSFRLQPGSGSGACFIMSLPRSV